MSDLIEKVPAKITKINYKCPKCKKGHLVAAEHANVLLTSPPQIQHNCTECKYMTYLTTSYPYNEVTEDRVNRDFVNVMFIVVCCVAALLLCIMLQLVNNDALRQHLNKRKSAQETTQETVNLDSAIMYINVHTGSIEANPFNVIQHK